MRYLVVTLPLVLIALCALILWGLFQVIEFANPSMLWLSLLVVAWGGIWAWNLGWRQSVSQAFYGSPELESKVPSFSLRRAVSRFAFTALGLFMLVLAAAEPQWGEIRRQVQRQGIDVVLAVDASRSMLAEDIAPDRLRAATEEIHTLLRSLHGDRVGLVVFAGFAFTQSPLTSDYGAIRLYLDRIRPDALPAQGTAIGRAIQEGHRLLSGGDDPEFKRSPNQLIVVISDGEDHETRPVDAASAALEDGVRVFTVGIGTPTGGRIPLRDPRGNFTGYLTDRNGQVVNTTLVDAQLQEIAQAGGGTYIAFGQPGSAARALQAEIEKFEEATVSSMLRSDYVSRPYFFLISALIFLLGSLLIDARPRSHRDQLGLRGLRWLLVMSALSSALLTPGCLDLRQRDPHIRAAVGHAEAGDVEEALDRIERAGDDARAQHAFYFNRGRLHELAERWEEAQEDYLRALASPQESLRVAAMIGVGNALVGQEKYEAALERYRRALVIQPGNEVARRNYEIAHLLRFPACAQLDDALEPNNSLEHASALPAEVFVGEWAQRFRQSVPPPENPEEKTKLVLCGGNVDIFTLPVVGAERLLIRADFRRLRDDDGGPPLPDKIPATALRLSILDNAGEIVAVDQGLQGNVSEAIDAKRVQRMIQDLVVDAERAPYALHVSADPGREYTYTLSVDITPPCSAVDDAFEPNDDLRSAAPLQPGEHQLRICDGNEDWFLVGVDAGEDVFIDVSSPADKAGIVGAISTTLRVTPNTQDPAAGSMTRISPHTGFEELSAREVWTPSTATLGVRNEEGHEGPYALSVHRFGPCPTGNDRFEPNDRPNQATALTAEQNPLRHLRLCPQDEDWYLMQLPEREADPAAAPGTQAEKTPTRFAAVAEYEVAARTVIIELWDPTTGRILTRSQSLEGTDYTSDAPGAAVAYAELDPDANAVLMRVLGDPGYYHLRFPDTQPPPSSGEDSQDAADQDPSDDESEGDDDAEADSDGEQQEPPEDDEDDSAQPDPERSEEEERQALMQLLESLEDSDMNLQLMQALERLPPVRSQNEW